MLIPVDLKNFDLNLNFDFAKMIGIHVKINLNWNFVRYEKVHESTNIPIIAYNNPGRCAVNMSVETILELSKDSNTDLSRVLIIKSQNPDFIMLSGDDPSFPGYLAHGGDGCISVTANVAPRLIKKLITSWEQQDTNTTKEIAMTLAPLSSALFTESNPIPVKYALSKMGFMNNELRLPLTPASEKTMQIIDNILHGIVKKVPA